MKKRIATLCLVLVLVLSFTACIRFEATVKINTNGTADIRMLMAVSDALASMGDGQPMGLSEEKIAEYKANGVTYEEYTDVDGGYTGYILSRKGIAMQARENKGNETGMESILDGEVFKVEGKHVTIDFAPMSDSEYEESGSYLSMLKNYGGYMKFNLELPVKPTNHNATAVSEDGKTLTWDLTKLKANESVHAEFDMPSGTFLAWLIPLICVIIAAIVAAIILVKKKKNNLVNEAVESELDTNLTTDDQQNENQTPEDSI